MDGTDGGADALKFIIDEPAPVDFFDTHTPVAAAIAQAITDNPGLKIIGLLGRWGSGKSTIVRDVGEKLKAADPNYLIFTYDAWLHQNDPLRRSFLESLVTFLTAQEGIIDAEDWDRRVKILSGSIRETTRYDTPLITPEAKLFFILAAAFGLGLSFLSLDLFSAALGATRSDAGFATLLLTCALLVGPFAIWTFRWLLLFEKGGKPPYFPAMIFNKDLGHVHSLTYQPVDSTSIEFGKEFRKLMKEIRQKDVRLVIVIDNMDRIADDEAMKIWASARSFFLSANDDNFIDSEPYHPTLILPVDSKSISHMFASDGDEKKGRRLARSFINKTFDVTFDVPAPVMSDWKRYLVDKMQSCLGSAFTHERAFRTRQFLEAWFVQEKIAITPREINKAINHMVALLIRCQGRPVTFESLAYYSINSERIADEIEAEVSRDNHPLARFSEDWAREIAALHFGVDVDTAGQVLMTGPIQRAIVEDDETFVEPYRKVVGYGDILDEVTENLPTGEASNSPIFNTVTNAAWLVALESDDEPWRPSAWKNLVGAFASAELDVRLIGLEKRIQPFFDHVAAEDAQRFSKKLVEILDRTVSTVEFSREAFNEIGAVGSKLLGFCDQHELLGPWIDCEGDATRYVRLLSGLRPYPELQKRMRGNPDGEAIVAELARRLNENTNPGSVPDLLPLLTSDAATAMIDEPLAALSALDPLFAAAEAVARSQAGDSDAYRAAIRTLGTPVGDREVRDAAFNRLTDEGFIGGQIEATAKSGDTKAIAVMAAVLIWKNINFASPFGGSWSAFLQKFPAAPAAINRLLDQHAEYVSGAAIDILMKNYDDHVKPRDLVKALMADRVERRDLGALVPAKVARNLYYYSRMIDSYALREEFASLLPGYEKFWDNVQSSPWARGLYDTAILLQKKGSEDAPRFIAELLEKARKSPKEEWVKAIDEAAEPIRVATQLLSADDLKFGTGSALFDALVATAAGAAEKGKGRLARWFALADILSGPGRRKAYDTIGQAVLAFPTVVRVRLLKTGGKRFFEDAGFAKRPDETIDKLILPFARLVGGRQWLTDYAGPIRKIIDHASDAHQAKLRRLIKECAKASRGDQRDWSEKIAKAWAIND